MTQLVIGAAGLVGAHLLRDLQQTGKEVYATFRNVQVPNAFPLDITKASEVKKLIRMIHPKIVYLSAALTNVDFCELHPDETYQINVRGVQNIVQTCNDIDAKLIFFSTDYIFDGENGPYKEDEIANPISHYGRQKLAAEHYIALFSQRYVIIRTTVVYGWESQGKNFIARLIRLLRENRPVKAPVDQIGTPTFVNNLAEISVRLAHSGFTGTINVSGPEAINRYELARTTAEVFGLDTGLVIPVSTPELNQAAKRPLVAGLRTEKISRLYPTASLTDFYTGLTIMFSNSLL